MIKNFRVIEGPEEEVDLPRPGDIRLSESGVLLGGFGKHEVEATAGKLVQFFQNKGRWLPFTITELYEFYCSQGWNPNKMFFGLLGTWYDDSYFRIVNGTEWVQGPAYLVIGNDGKYRVTEEFVTRCAGT